MAAISDVTYLDVSSKDKILGREEQFSEAIEAINKSINCVWERYTSLVKKYLHSYPFIFAQKKEELIGYVIVESLGSTCYIPFLAIKSSEQRQSIGTGLMKQAIEKTKELGSSVLTLECRDVDQLPTFYTKVGRNNPSLLRIESNNTYSFYSNGDKKVEIRYYLK